MSWFLVSGRDGERQYTVVRLAWVQTLTCCREETKMLNFEEELKRFQPCLEVQDIEEAVYQEDLADMTDLLREVIEQTNK